MTDLIRVALLSLITVSCFSCKDAREVPHASIPANEIVIVTGLDSADSVTVPWKDGLTVLDALASRGGYLNSQLRNAHLVRDGHSEPLNMRALIQQPELDIKLRKGDRIELR